MNKISDYLIVLLGAYMVIGLQSAGVAMKWWSPLVWIIAWAFIEIPVRVFRRHHKRHLAALQSDTPFEVKQ